MPRIPFKHIPGHPPYIRRSRVHEDMTRAIENLEIEPNILLGDQASMGVTRTLSSVTWEWDNIQFRDMRRRYPVVIDFYPNAHLSLAENLALIRNQVIRTLDRHFTLPDIEVQLFEFDALYHVWRDKLEFQEGIGIPLVASKFRSRSERIAKRIFSIGTRGLFEALELFSDVTAASLTATATYDTSVESLGDRAYKALSQFLRVKITPRISGALRDSGVDWEDPRPDALGDAMLEFLGAFLITMSRRLDNGYLLLIIDSIDEVEDTHPNSLSLRAAFSKLIAQCVRSRMPAVLGGRAPAAAWSTELSELSPTPHPLGLIEIGSIRSALISAGISRDTIDRVMQALGSYKGGLSAGQFAELWQREAC